MLTKPLLDNTDDVDTIVLARHSSQFKDNETGNNLDSEGFVYSCKGLLNNMWRQVDGCGEAIAVSTDTTFNLLTEGWCLYSIGCRSLVRTGETLRQKYRPFAFLLSRTERGDGYELLFESLLTVQPWLDIETYQVKALCSDHHDGLIKVARKICPEGESITVT